MKIALLLGSIRIGRQSHKAALYLQKQWNTLSGVEVELIDLADYHLPMMEERYGLHPSPADEVVEIGEKLIAADAVVLISPEYSGSYSGVLKNATDYFGRQISGKPVGVVATSGGRLGGINASHQMQNLVLSMRAYPMPRKLLLAQVQDAFDEDNMPTDEATKLATEEFIREFTWFARALVNAKKERRAAALQSA